MSRRYACTALTGGAAGALDDLVIAGGTPNSEALANGDSAVVAMISGETVTVYEYTFDIDGTDAEDSPSIIRPDDFATAGVWRLAKIPDEMLPDSAATDTDIDELKTIQVNVRDYGATGDGATDDSSAVDTAVEYCVANKLRLFFPKGDYLLSSAVAATFAGNLALVIEGAGPALSRIIVNNGTGGILLTSTARSTPVVLKNIGFYANIENSGTAFQYVVPAGGVQPTRIFRAENVTIMGLDYTADTVFDKCMVVTGMYRPMFSNVVCWGMYQNASTLRPTCVIDISDTYSPVIKNCYFNGKATYGVYKNSATSEGLFFYNNVVNGADTGLYFVNQSAEPQFEIVGNHFNNTRYGIRVDGAKFGHIANNLFYADDHYDTSASEEYDDILIENGWGIEIDGNIFRMSEKTDRRHVNLTPRVDGIVRDITIDVPAGALQATTSSSPFEIGEADNIALNLPSMIPTLDSASYPATLYNVDAAATDIAIRVDGQLIADGSFAAPITANPYALSFAQCFGGKVFYGATGEIDLPPGKIGMHVFIINTGAFTITMDPNASEVIVREGTAQTGGVPMTLSSGAGNFVEMIFDGRWVTLSKVGTLAEGS